MILKIKNSCQCAYNKIKTCSQNFFPSRANLRSGRAKFSGNFDLGRAFCKLSSLDHFNTFAINWHMYLHTEKTIANLLPYLYHIHIIFAIAANFLYSYTDVSTIRITCLAEKRDFLFFFTARR